MKLRDRAVRQAEASDVDARVSAGTRIRFDIEGLRAIAVVSVVIYHVNSSWLPGGFSGVDIFFVISGYLITSHLMKEIRATGRLKFGRFYARRILRLIPAATVVLLATTFVTLLVVPRFYWRQIAEDVSGAALYVVNWIFAARSVDYLAEDSVVSPVQHFWSLSVEEQFYIAWPVLLVAVSVLALKIQVNLHAAVTSVLALVVVGSFSYAVFATSNGDATAYFNTAARVWELALGALVATSYPILSRVKRSIAGVLQALGAVLVVTGLVVVSPQAAWPGTLTLLPVIGTALLIAFGDQARGLPLGRILENPGLVWLGGISYSLYLWHWPILVLAAYVPHGGSIEARLLCIVAAIVFSWLSKHLVEDPLRRWPALKNRAPRSLATGAGMAVLSVGIASTLVVASSTASQAAPAGAEPQGAAIIAQLGAHPELLDEQPTWIAPAPLDATKDVPQLYADECQQKAGASAVLACSYGATNSDVEVAIVGDSKANQWLPAFDDAAATLGVKITVMTKSACAFTDAPTLRDGQPYPSCDEWNGKVEAELLERHPAAVFTSMVNPQANVEGDEATRRHTMTQGLASRLLTLRDAGIKTVVIGDNPHPSDAVYVCVGEHPDDVDQCNFSREEGTARSALPVQRDAVELAGGSVVGFDTAELGQFPVLLDPTDYICPGKEGQCGSVIGNALVYRQGSHLTATYVQTLAPQIQKILEAVL